MKKSKVRQFRALAGEGFTAEEIAGMTGEKKCDIESATVAKSLDPEAVWSKDRQSMNLSEPSRELFVRLFAERNRDRIILEATNLVRSYVAAHVARTERRWEFSDLESTAIVAVIEEVDRLLGKNIEHTNPGSVLIDRVRGTIYEPDRDLHSRPYRIYKPRGKPARHLRTESPWPTVKDLKGEREEVEFGFPQPPSDERWELLRELCDESELQILDLFSRGHTREEVAAKAGCHATTVSKTVNRVRERVQRHLQD